MNAVLQDTPLPARLVPWPAALPTTLTRCVLLALLLHVWLILMLGSAPGGTARLGQGVWGAINVTLRGPVSDGASAEVLPPVPPNPVAGPSTLPRWGGNVRNTDAPRPDQPGAAQLGATAPVPRAEATVPATPEPPAPAGRVLEERITPDPVPAPVESRLQAPALRQPMAPAPGLAETGLSAPVISPSPALPALPSPTAVVAAPRPERQVASPLQQAPAAAAAAALPRTTAPALMPDLATPPPVAEAPPPVRRLQAAPAAARAPEPALSPSAEAPALVVPQATPLPSATLPSARPGAPDAGNQIGHDVATPPGAAASAPPRLNLHLTRPRGGELSRFGSTAGALPVLPRPPERDEKLAKEIEKAGKTDCRNAYTGMGPLAVIPLAVDVVRKDGACKW